MPIVTFLVALAFCGSAFAGDGIYSTGVVVAKVKFCKVANPNECREIEIVPQGHKAVSVVECMRGVSMAAAEFTFEGERWRTRGGTCREEPSEFLAWLREKTSKQ